MKTTLTVDNDGVLSLEDNVLQWIDNKDGSFSLVKPDET